MRKFVIDHIGEVTIGITILAALVTTSEWFWLFAFETGR